MRKAVFSIVLVFGLLLSFGVYAEPTLLYNTTNIQGSYNYNFVYEFTSVWDANITENENITACNFILERPNGTITSYTLTPNSAIPPSSCFFNITQNDLGPTGNYNYSWSVKNDTTWVTNISNNFTIEKAVPLPIHLFLNDIENNKTNFNGYRLNDIANFSVLLDTNGAYLADNTTYLYSNFTGWDVQNSNNSTFFNYSLNLNHTGLFYLTANWSGNSNYSMSNKTYFFTVTDLNWLSNSTSIPSGSIYTSGRNYSFQISWTGNVSKVLFDWNGNNSSYVNNTGNTYWVNLTDLPGGNYIYKWYANDTNNIWSSSDFWNYTVAQITTSLNFSSSSSSATPSSTVTFSCSVNNNPLPSPGLQLTLSSGTCTGTNSFTSCSVIMPSVQNTYTYYCTASGNQNYSTVSSPLIILVQSVTTTPTPTTNPGTPSSSSSNSFIITNSISSLSMKAGETKTIPFTISNTLSSNVTTLVNVTISVTGLDSSWYSISNTNLSYVYRNNLKNLTITFKIPSNAEARSYDVNITASGKIYGTSTYRTTPSKSMKLTVTSSQPVAIPPITQPENNETLPSVATEQANNTQNMTSNQTLVGPTGLAATFEYLKNNLVIIIAIATCLLIFFFRSNITETMTRGKVPQRMHKQLNLPSLKNYKLIVGLKKGKDEPEMPERLEPKPEVKRPQVLEREIKRDIKELQQIIDSEKKIDRKKKNIKMENN